MIVYNALRRVFLPYIPRAPYVAQLVWRRAPLWKKAGIIFIHIPKNGGTSLSQALYGQFMGHFSALEVCTWTPTTFQRLPSLALSRNPWDRCLSAYRFAKAGIGKDAPSNLAMTPNAVYHQPVFDSFETFVLEWLPSRNLFEEDIVFQPQSHFINDKAGKKIVSHVGRIEDLAAVEEYLLSVLNRSVFIGHANRTGQLGHYRAHYSPKMRDIVGDIYQNDIGTFGYDF